MPDGYLDTIPPRDLTVVRLLERRAADSPDGTFFSWADDTTTFGEFNAAVNRMARRLQHEGVTPGTHVAVLMDTSPDYLTLWFALAKVGAVEIPINTAYLGEMLHHQLTSSTATVCVADAAYAERIVQIAPSIPRLEHLYVRGRPSPIIGAASRDFAVLLAADVETDPGLDVDHDSTAGIIFTSGTTGPSKGVLLSHHYLAAYGTMYADINGLRSDDVLLNFLPFFHVGAKFLTIATLVCGGRMRLLPRLSISTFLDEVTRHGVTNFVAVGGVCNMLLSKPPRPDDTQSSIRTIYAVPDPADIHEEMERRFGCRMTTVYGSTEVGLPIFRGVDDDYRPGSCGRQSPYYEVRVVDEHDNEVPVGEPGELVIRPRRPYLVGSGYIGMPERTVEAWRNLWLHSGDRGRMDADGWFYFEDRATDSLRRRGENISSFEVETLVTGHPAVSEAIAVAAAADVGEDDVWVLVTLRDGMDVEPEELLRYCAEKMPYFMVPRYLDIVQDFPRTPTAKVEKYKLRAAGPGSTTWDREAHGWRVTRDGLVRTVGADLLGSR
ncbi:AMP-binding protein [Pseudonocardia sp. NPDC049154]|uniref:AMP-binding protein n=1 Tax=Pseudonocardia sp. NPDC049154 TaxID=3155501 RepID=UPI0034078B63